MSISQFKNFYPGHLLVANPANPRDELAKSVIFLASHNPHMAIGIQLNNSLSHMTLREVADNTGLDTSHPSSRLDVPLYYGGVHGVHRVQIVHTPEWRGLSTVALNKDLSLTSDLSVLNALSIGRGPKRFRACEGQWNWEDGDLDRQLDKSQDEETHRWEISPANIETALDLDGNDQWRHCLITAAQYTTMQWF